MPWSEDFGFVGVVCLHILLTAIANFVAAGSKNCASCCLSNPGQVLVAEA